MTRRPAALALLLALFAAGPLPAAEPSATVAPPESLVLDNVPPIPADLPERAGRYTEFRGATLADWHPTRREMLILTRFGDTQQVHLVKNPGGARTQLTFFPDRVESARFEPTQGDYFVFNKGTGGAEFFQNYRYDMDSGDVTLLTDGKSRNSAPVFANDGKQIAYTSTRRNGTDTDIYIQNPLDPKSAKLLAEVKGGGWQIEDWSPDNGRLLVLEYVSINETYLWQFDARTGERTEVTPRIPGEEKIARLKARYTKDGKGLLALSDKGSDTMRLAHHDFGTDETTFLPIQTESPKSSWDVEDFALSRDGRCLAFTINAGGYTDLEVIIRGSGSSAGGFVAPAIKSIACRGTITGLRFNPRDGSPLALKNNAVLDTTFAFTLSDRRTPADVYEMSSTAPDRREFDVQWTASETGALGPNARNFVEAGQVSWQSFDGREISGFLYSPDRAKHPGKRPVIVNIHGGPESQYRPGFLGRNNYLINELGCAMIFPNVRGSAGYGKTFLTLDDGLKREDSYKDIGALLDWIRTQPNLDADRVMLTGGSYGGHMTLACATLYADRIRCAVDIVGMSNLRTFLERTESYRRDLRRAEYGDERDPATREFMERTAPLNNAAKITRPLFVIQGANDPRVPRSEAEQIVATLKKQGTPVPYLLAKDEGHGFAKKKNADFQFLATVEFIRRYLLGDEGAVP